MNLRRFLALPPPTTSSDLSDVAAGPDATSGLEGLRPDDPEAAAVRRIVARLEAMPPDHARHLASYAYILARAAAAEFDISDAETRTIERLLVEHGDVNESQAVVVAEIAKSMARLVGGTEDYLVTRDFAERSTPEERLGLLRACFVVGAADESITASESSVLNEIANELGVDAVAATALRAEFADRFSALQALRRGR
ncbi:MAG: TerB family tellurite resistance protein [Chloroflexi bacterium]|nr:TerB family tellurite resistance protein [Chloroflexota bacterium]